MEKMKKVLQKQKGVGKHSRRIACLLLALVLTITGLPLTGGVEQLKAMATISVGDCAYGNYDDTTRTLTVWGSGEADDFYAGYDWNKVKPNVTTIIFKKGITSVAHFIDCPKLTTIELRDPNVTLTGTAFWYCSNIKTVILAPETTEQTKNQISVVLSSVNVGSSSEIAYEKEYNLMVISGKFDGGTDDSTNNVCKKTYRTSELGAEGKK